jgi:WD40 repeat protein
MDSALRALWGRRLYSRLPLLGGWVRLRAVRKLAADDTPEAVRLLAEAVARSEDRRVLIGALEALQEVERPRCVEAVCEVWARTRNVYLEELIRVAGWLPRAPVAVRVLYHLLRSRQDEAAAGGAEVVESLLRHGADADVKVAARAREALGRLQSAEAREELCRLAIDGDALAGETAVGAGYAPREAGQRALLFFLTGQWDAYEALDFDRRLLRAVYHAADAPLRQRVADAARRAGRVEWVEVVTGGRQSLRLAEMTDAEWEATREVLVSRRQWAELWRLAQDAPPRWSARLLQRLEVLDGLAQDRGEQEELLRLARAWHDPHLASLIRPRAVWDGHEAGVYCLAISADGRLLASGGGDHRVRLWDVAAGREVRTLEGHADAVTHLAVSPRGKVLVSGGGEGSVHFWRLPGGEPLGTRARPLHTSGVICLAVPTRGRLIASTATRGDVWVWDLADGQPVRCLKGEAGRLAMSPDGGTLAVADWLVGFIQLWGLPDSRKPRTLTAKSGAPDCLAFSPDSRTLAGGGKDGLVHLWDVPAARRLGDLRGHSGWVESLAFSPDGRTLASSGKDSTVRLWHLPEGKAGEPLAGHIGPVRHLAFSPDGRVLASGGEDGTVELWSVPDGQPLRTLREHTKGLTGLAISADGHLLASSGAGVVRLWGSELVRLSRMPVGRITPQDMTLAEEALAEPDLSAGERAALEFIVALARWRLRYDILLDEGPRHIEAGEFDIIIAG